MKRWMVAAVLMCLFLLVAVIVVVVLVGSRKAPEKEPAAQASSVLAFVEEKFPNYRFRYDEASGSLTFSENSSLTYENACAYGSQVYEGNTAPETYLSQVQIISLAVQERFSLRELSVVLEILSSDGQVIFSVDSTGSIRTCWKP